LDSRTGPTPAAAAAEEAAARARRIPGDHIAVVVNSEVVTAGEIAGRAERVREEARRAGQAAPDLLTAREAAREQLVEERVLVTYARDSGARVEEPELDRVVANVAVQNRLTLPQLTERLKSEGIDFKRFRENLRDQMLQERVRDREVSNRVRVTDGEIDKFLEERQRAARTNAPINVAQILITVPTSATSSEREAARLKAEGALARVRGGENFAVVARALSEDGNRERGGEIGLRGARGRGFLLGHLARRRGRRRCGRGTRQRQFRCRLRGGEWALAAALIDSYPPAAEAAASAVAPAKPARTWSL
jgi:peptidyl-prolyl cis-trans isomerase SurA